MGKKVTNELGFTFEVDDFFTAYAHEFNYKNNTKGLPKEWIVLRISKEDNFYGYILFDTKNQKPLSNEKGVEEMGAYIDILKFKGTFD